MTMENWIECNRLNALYKKRLKRERSNSWKRWVESLSPRTPIKDIFRRLNILSNYRVPNQPNVMFQDPKIVKNFLNNLRKTNNPSKSP